jgi:ABC-type phosphate/phosphonate transport system permease subunit
VCIVTAQEESHSEVAFIESYTLSELWKQFVQWKEKVFLCRENIMYTLQMLAEITCVSYVISLALSFNWAARFLCSGGGPYFCSCDDEKAYK